MGLVSVIHLDQFVHVMMLNITGLRKVVQHIMKVHSCNQDCFALLTQTITTVDIWECVQRMDQLVYAMIILIVIHQSVALSIMVKEL